ncbi:MAG: HAD family hydrolase [Candidatus Cloacimonetes bacterium]|nr:HAD family hydrolase [Candidatus Cloacimonadota bacterium]
MRDNLRRAIFLDRDGTINPDGKGYIRSPEEFKVYTYAGEAIKKLQDSGFLIFIVTNQSGIARGLYTMQDLEAIHLKMKELLQQQGVSLDEVFFSPYHKEGVVAPYNIDHEDRKPGLGLFYQAMKKYTFENKESYMIGDKYTDIEFGKKAGLRTILVLSGNGSTEFRNDRESWEYHPDFIVKDLLQASNLILSLEEKK